MSPGCWSRTHGVSLLLLASLCSGTTASGPSWSSGALSLLRLCRLFCALWRVLWSLLRRLAAADKEKPRQPRQRFRGMTHLSYEVSECYGL